MNFDSPCRCAQGNWSGPSGLPGVPDPPLPWRLRVRRFMASLEVASRGFLTDRWILIFTAPDPKRPGTLVVADGEQTARVPMGRPTPGLRPQPHGQASHEG